VTGSHALKDAVATLFSTTSSRHDSVGGLFAHFGSRLVEWSGLHAGDRVLDVAAGTGQSLVPAAARVGDAGHVTGMDLAPGMVELLRRTIREHAPNNADALVADAEQLPFDDGTFDAVLCGFGLFFFPDPGRALAEFRRVLRAGGVVAISTFTRAGSASMDRTWRLIGEHIAVPAPAADETRFHDPDQLVSALRAARFSNIEIEVSPFDIVLPDAEAWLDWLRSMEFGEYVDKLSADAVERLKSSAAAVLGGAAGSEEIRFTMDALLTRANRR
jgi:ubiquinone/menaquinone biosynthesis C-methylase UbiE